MDTKRLTDEQRTRLGPSVLPSHLLCHVAQVLRLQDHLVELGGGAACGVSARGRAKGAQREAEVGASLPLLQDVQQLLLDLPAPVLTRMRAKGSQRDRLGPAREDMRLRKSSESKSHFAANVKDA